MRFNYLDKETLVTTSTHDLSAGTLAATALVLTAPMPDQPEDAAGGGSAEGSIMPHQRRGSGTSGALSGGRKGKPPRHRGPRHFLHS